MQNKHPLVEELFGFMFEEALCEEIHRVAEVRRLPSGAVIMEVGDSFQWMPIVLSGAVKVMREDPDGNELLLYFLEAGDTCVMSFSCCMGKKKASASRQRGRSC